MRSNWQVGKTTLQGTKAIQLKQPFIPMPDLKESKVGMMGCAGTLPLPVL